MNVAGAVLCGGRSSRMGSDKALLKIDGVPMVVRVATALTQAGCRPVTAIGGDRAHLESLGVSVIDDAWPGEGPVGGVFTALSTAGTADAVVVVACDMPYLSAATVRSMIDALAASPGAEAAVAASERSQPLCAVWRRSACSSLLDALERGERRLHAVLSELVTVSVEVNLQDLTNVNTPDDLPTRL